MSESTNIDNNNIIISDSIKLQDNNNELITTTTNNIENNDNSNNNNNTNNSINGSELSSTQTQISSVKFRSKLPILKQRYTSLYIPNHQSFDQPPNNTNSLANSLTSSSTINLTTKDSNNNNNNTINKMNNSTTVKRLSKIESVDHIGLKNSTLKTPIKQTTDSKPSPQQQQPKSRPRISSAKSITSIKESSPTPSTQNPKPKQSNIVSAEPSTAESPAATKTNDNSTKSDNLSRLRQFKLQQQKQLNTKQGSVGGDYIVEIKSNKSLGQMLKHARASGQLNLSNQSLTEVPLSVWRINVDRFEDEENNTNKTKNANYISFDHGDDDDSLKWWEQVDLQKLILASNKIKKIPKEVEFVNTITTFDAHDNEIQSIDEAFGTLTYLQNLNLSHNQIKQVPKSFCKLQNITVLNLAYNELTELPKDIGYLDYLEELNLSHNLLTELPKSFSFFNKLRTMNISSNKLKNLLPEVFYSQSLRDIDLCDNEIEYLPKQIGELVSLEQLYISKNQIKEFPVLNKCCQLKDFDIANNEIKEIEKHHFSGLTSLVTLNLRDNKIESLPNDIYVLTKLERLDLTNNNLSNLPCELSLLDNMKQVLLAGNPLRSIRKDILNRGTDAIIKSLKNHLTEAPTPRNEAESGDIRMDVIRTSRVFDYSAKKATELPPNFVHICCQCSVTTINLSKNRIHSIPSDLNKTNEHLTQFIYSFNQLTTLPNTIYTLKNLITLDIRGNQLTQLNNELKEFDQLRELIIADNRFSEIPDCIFDIKNLEVLFANDNKIQIINVPRLKNLKYLSTLNLQNNDIQQVPPELGKCTNLKSLQLEGNPFRLPRPTILAKGTAAVLEYLRGRITDPNNNEA